MELLLLTRVTFAPTVISSRQMQQSVSVLVSQRYQDILKTFLVDSFFVILVRARESQLDSNDRAATLCSGGTVDCRGDSPERWKMETPLKRGEAAVAVVAVGVVEVVL